MILIQKMVAFIGTHRPMKALIRVTMYLIILMVIFTFGYKYIEGDSWIESFWQSWQTFSTVGYGNKPAETDIGRIFTIIFGTLGIAVLAIFISLASDMKQYLRAQNRIGNMTNKFTDGYVIINYPGKTEAIKIIEQLRHVENDVPVCFVDADLECLPDSVATLSNVFFVRGGLSERNTYSRANISKNKAVIVFPSDSDADSADLETKSIVDLIYKFVDDNVRVMYILTNPENTWLFPPKAKSIIRDFWVFNLVQECQGSNCSDILEKMVNNADNESINCVKWVEEKISWKELVVKSLETPAYPIALSSGGSIKLAPRNSIIEKGDIVFFNSPNNYDLDQIMR